MPWRYAGDLRILRYGKGKRDINIDAFRCEGFNSRYPFGRGRHFDHKVLTIDFCPKAPGFCNRLLRFICQVRGNLNTYKSISSGAALINRAKYVCSELQVFNLDPLKHRFSVQLRIRSDDAFD
jgi:hypothetical protein